MSGRSAGRILFMFGDYAAGALTGGITAATVHRLIGPETDMILAMLAGTALGMVVHLVLALLLSPLLGAFHVMIPGSLIGMYGGMFFAMRRTMQMPDSIGHAVMVGLVFGVVIVALVQVYNFALKSERGTEHS